VVLSYVVRERTKRCTLLFEKGLTDRLTVIEKCIDIQRQDINFALKAVNNMKRAIDTNAATMWMSMSELYAGINVLSRDLLSVQESIERERSNRNL